MIRCTHCDEAKPPEAYNRNSRNANGCTQPCKPCRAKARLTCGGSDGALTIQIALDEAGAGRAPRPPAPEHEPIVGDIVDWCGVLAG